MNELLQKHGCSNVFTVPEGLKELMSDITREVLREQPPKIFDFIANYLSVLLITREHGIMAVKILDDLCDCRPSVSEHLLQLGLEKDQATVMSQIIKEEIEGFEPVEGKEKVREMQIMKKILTRNPLEETMAAKVCQVVRNAYRDYWYRKKLLEQTLKDQPDEPWEIAAQHTLEIYKKTKPSFSELTRAAQKIQAAYRGYHVRRNLLKHLKPKPKSTGPKVELPGPPLDTAASREIDLGPVISIKVRDDNVSVMFDEAVGEKLGLQYDPMKTITHIDDDGIRDQIRSSVSRTTKGQSRVGGLTSAKSLASRSEFRKESQFLTPQQSQYLSEEEMRRQSRLQSQMIDVEPRKSHVKTTISEMGPRQSRLPSQLPEAESRISRLPSQIPEPRKSRMSHVPEPRLSRLPSQAPTIAEPSLQRISFAEVPPEVIPDVDEDEEKGEVPEIQEILEAEAQPEGAEPAEAQPEGAEAPEAESAQEVPEDIAPDDQTDGEASAPIASEPTSAPVSADVTDVEDAVEDMGTSEEEGE